MLYLIIIFAYTLAQMMIIRKQNIGKCQIFSDRHLLALRLFHVLHFFVRIVKLNKVRRDHQVKQWHTSDR